MTGHATPHRVAFCARCKQLRKVVLIRGANAARDLERCPVCDRTWPIGRIHVVDRETRGIGE